MELADIPAQPVKKRNRMKLDAKIPEGPIQEKWSRYRNKLKLVNPSNKRKFRVIVVGSGLAGASAAATMSELGYAVDCFCFQDSPRRAHSIAAQGGINDQPANEQLCRQSSDRLRHGIFHYGQMLET